LFVGGGQVSLQLTLASIQLLKQHFLCSLQRSDILVSISNLAIVGLFFWQRC